MDLVTKWEKAIAYSRNKLGLDLSKFDDDLLAYILELSYKNYKENSDSNNVWALRLTMPFNMFLLSDNSKKIIVSGRKPTYITREIILKNPCYVNGQDFESIIIENFRYELNERYKKTNKIVISKSPLCYILGMTRLTDHWYSDHKIIYSIQE